MGYRFSKRLCTVEIEDSRYNITISRALYEKIAASRDKLAALSGAPEGEVITAVDEAINGILGKGACGKIFAGREVNAAERCDVLAYIYRELAAFTDRIAGDADVRRKAEDNYSA